MTVLLLENNLREQLGHFLNCTTGLKREAQAEGADVKVYINMRASKEVLKQTEGYPIFKHLSWDGDKARDPITSMRKLGEEFYRQCLKIEGIFSSDLILIGTALENQVYGIAKFMESLPPARRPKVALNFHWENISENEKRIPAYTEAFSLLKQVIDPACVIITAATAGIVEKITSVSEGLTVKLFPCPQNYGEIRPTLKAGNIAHPILAVLGRSLRRKGSSTIHKTVRRLRKRVPQLRYLIQATYKAPEMMLLLFTQDVRLHFGGISQDAYFEYLRSSDIFLMPYSTKAYSDRVSGILADCAAWGALQLCPQKLGWQNRCMKNMPRE
jgi:glycosyltransferase involved in cell wall biosynthesis